MDISNILKHFSSKKDEGYGYDLTVVRNCEMDFLTFIGILLLAPRRSV